MHYTKLSVAGCAALMFGLIACSGEDGKDGVNGVNGLNGADGASCEVKSLKDESGYKVLCGGDSVGVLLNGKTGATGKQGVAGATGAKGDTGKTGESCSVQSITDGYKVLCGGKEVGTLKNGTNGKDGKSCTTSTATDGIVIDCNGTTTKITNGKDGKTCSATTVTKNGRKGIEMSCDGEVVGTVWDGQDATATGACTSTDKGNGVYELNCGDAPTMTMYKAVCGVDPYDPADKFCVLGKLYDKCGTDKVAYKVNTEFCENGKVVPACIYVKQTLDPDNPSAVITQVRGMRAPTADEFCLNGFIMPKCNGEEYGIDQFCGKTADKTKDSLMTYCARKSYLEEEVDEWLDFKANKEKEVAEAAEIDKDPSSFGNLIGQSLLNINEKTNKNLSADEAEVVARIKDYYDMLDSKKLKANEFCENYEVVAKCGTKTYKTKNQFCDMRDNRIYGMAFIEGQVWMTENLAFEYKLPMEVTKGKASVGTDINFADTAYQNYTSTIAAAGRYYSWFAANGIDDVRYDAAAEDKVSATALPAEWYTDPDKMYKTLPGACPDGWRLPTKDELDAVIRNAAKDNVIAQKMNFVKSGYYNITFTLVPNEDPEVKEYTKNQDFTSSSKVFLWTADEDTDGEAIKAVGLVDISTYKFESYDKNMALPIRCVFDIPIPVIDDGDGDGDGVGEP